MRAASKEASVLNEDINRSGRDQAFGVAFAGTWFDPDVASSWNIVGLGQGRPFDLLVKRLAGACLVAPKG